MIPGQIVLKDYTIVKKIAQGSFGYVYKVVNKKTKQFYALKTDQKSVTKMQMQNQVAILQQITKKIKQSSQNIQSQSHLGYFYQYFLSSQSSNKMIMPLYGQNIFNLFDMCNKRFDSNTIYKIAVNMLKCIEYLHELGFIHRDIKPQNFVIGNSGNGGDGEDKNKRKQDQNTNDDKIYLVDFGLTKTYLLKQKNGKEQHIPYEIGRKIRGTPMYMSINIILGIQPSRRDDLQSLMYIIVLMMKGRLPWHGLKISKKDLSDLMLSKISISPNDLFQNLPKQLKLIYIYIRQLKFQQNPDYRRIQNSFESIYSFKNQKIQEFYSNQYRVYCWQKIFQKQKIQMYDFGNVQSNGCIGGNWIGDNLGKGKKVKNQMQNTEKQITLIT